MVACIRTGSIGAVEKKRDVSFHASRKRMVWKDGMQKWCGLGKISTGYFSCIYVTLLLVLVRSLHSGTLLTSTRITWVPVIISLQIASLLCASVSPVTLIRWANIRIHSNSNLLKCLEIEESEAPCQG